MSLFLEWNSLLLQHYFSPANAGRDVWVPTTNVELENIGVHIGGAAGLIEAVKQGPSWLNHKENIATKATALVFHRSNFHRMTNGYCDPGSELLAYKGSRAPTYLPYLALWVLAQSEPNNGFYDKVSQLIGMPFPNDAGLDMQSTWRDLKFWTVDEQGGKFGRFYLNVLGAHKFVGMAYSQTMITSRDIPGINKLFASCKLHPEQNLNNNIFLQLLEHGGQSHYLSKGCQQAMKDVTYREQLRTMLTSLLESWDGVVAKNTSFRSRSLNGQEETSLSIDEEILINLQLKCEPDPQWEIGWRVPAVVTGMDYSLKVGDGDSVKAKLELFGTHISCMTDVNQSAARFSLDCSAKYQIDAVLNYSERNGAQSGRKFYLFNKKVRVLAWDTPDPSFSESLHEREMPIEGPVYLLYSTSEYLNLELFLSNEQIEHKFVDDMDGLPDGWKLIYIDKTESLSAEQRATITEEEHVATTKARIKFVGGKSISGVGARKYQFYDLPIIELEADVSAEISAEGLRFERLFDDPEAQSIVRRYRFILDDEIKCLFKIIVQCEEEVLCNTSLLVSRIGGLSTAQNENFSIDKFGKTLANGTGLRGAVIGSKPKSDVNLNINQFEVNKEDLTNCDQNLLLVSMAANVACLFLDSIASSTNGSMTFGVARDQIRRLAVQIGVNDIEPGFLLRDLWRRGHVEVETSVKGHMVRINAVQPTLYSLPIKDSGENFYGICGSLRLQHWRELAETHGVNLYVNKTSADKLPGVRVGAYKAEFINEISSGTFQASILPIVELAQWTGSVEEIKDELDYYQDRGSNPIDLQKLIGGKGLFIDWQDKRFEADKDIKYDLFRFEDPQIVGMRVYKLGRNLGYGYGEYSFISDSRWGVWATIWAFAAYVKNTHKIDDASPWPFHYESASGCLWLPARIEPPLIICRTLALCSGDGPILVDCYGEIDESSVLLRRKDGHLVGQISPIYSDMCTGKWLCYRWVPKEIANHLAHLLGGELQEF